MSIWPLSALSRRSEQFSSEPKYTAHLPFSILISCSASWLIFSPVSCRGIMLIRSIFILSPCHRLFSKFLLVLTKSLIFKIIRMLPLVALAISRQLLAVSKISYRLYFLIFENFIKFSAYFKYMKIIFFYVFCNKENRLILRRFYVIMMRFIATGNGQLMLKLRVQLCR